MENLNKEQLISEIKKKKELFGLSGDLVLDVLEEYIKKHKINLEKLGKREIKIVIKEIRNQLRKYSGMFQKSLKGRLKLLDDVESLLKTHRSTAERMDFYPRLKEIIKSLGVKSILDLGAGLNPIALAEKGIKYYAIDIREEDLKIVKEFFKRKNIVGKTFILDLRKISFLPKTDLCLIFKVLDIIEEKGHKIAMNIIEKINSKYILISFAKKTLSGKLMKHQRRNWFETILKMKGLSYKVFNSENEVFYLAEREQGLE